MTSEEQQRLLRRAVLEIGRRQKSQNLLYWGSEAPCAQTQVIPTGSLGLDLALGVGGWPRGRICEIVGAESAGKTTLALHAVCQAQRQGLAVLFVDAEHAFDRDYAAALGVD
ncbi:ATPase domain-containing protein, partial [Thermus sp.]|uniref:ATPase domain-containing protein n=1 Tax=Thermus sp. TaxID=275 RepID=UPI002628FF59